MTWRATYERQLRDARKTMRRTEQFLAKFKWDADPLVSFLREDLRNEADELFELEQALDRVRGSK